MTRAEIIIMGAAMRSNIRTSKALAERAGFPYTTLRYKMNHPKTITLGDVRKLDRVCHFTEDDTHKMVKAVRV